MYIYTEHNLENIDIKYNVKAYPNMDIEHNVGIKANNKHSLHNYSLCYQIRLTEKLELCQNVDIQNEQTYVFVSTK